MLNKRSRFKHRTFLINRTVVFSLSRKDFLHFGYKNPKKPKIKSFCQGKS